MSNDTAALSKAIETKNAANEAAAYLAHEFLHVWARSLVAGTGDGIISSQEVRLLLAARGNELSMLREGVKLYLRSAWSDAHSVSDEFPWMIEIHFASDGYCIRADPWTID